MAYCTVDELKVWSERTSSAADPEVALAITTTESWIDSYCQRTFEGPSSSDAREFEVCDHRLLDLGPFNDAVTVTSVKTDEGGDGTFETTWAASDYELLPLNAATAFAEPRPFTEIRAVNRCWPHSWSWGRKARVEVTGTWGWSAVPEPVKLACRIQASRLFMRRQSPEGVIGGFADFGPVRVPSRLDPDVEAMLGPYRHPTVGAVLIA